MGLIDNDNVQLNEQYCVFEFVFETVHQCNEHAQYTFGMCEDARICM